VRSTATWALLPASRSPNIGPSPAAAGRVTFGAMSTRRGPTYDDQRAAIAVALGGLAAGDDLRAILQKLVALHPRNNTFPAEVLLDLAADALEEAHATRADPLDYEGIRERYLPECEFRGRNDHQRSHYALGVAGMIKAGVRPDLLGDTYWWATDDLWRYAFYALTIYVRAAAQRSGITVGEVSTRIAARRGVELLPAPS
jgi:hypothetical protein